jgi:hypothetical protein
MAIAPLAAFYQYFAPASFFCALAISYVFSYETRIFRIITLWSVLPVLFFSTLTHIKTSVAQIINQVPNPVLMQVVAINRELKRYRDQFNSESSDCSDTIYSLSGAFIVDSGFSPSKYMEGGIFWPRLKGFIKSQYFVEYKYHIDPYSIDPTTWIRIQGIDFLLIGFYGDNIEESFRSYGRESRFEERVVGRIYNTTISLLYNPACVVRRP